MAAEKKWAQQGHEGQEWVRLMREEQFEGLA